MTTFARDGAGLLIGSLKNFFRYHSLLGLIAWTGLAIPLFGLGAPIESHPGITLIGASPVLETTAQIMARDQLAKARNSQVKKHPRPGGEFQDLPSNPGSVITPVWPPPSGGGGGGPVVPQSPQTLSLTFSGATLSDTASFPPDSMGAVGPSQFVVAVNGRIKSFTKAGVPDGVLNANSDVFFSSVMTPPVNNNFTSDPRIRYDRLSGRWFITIIDVPGQTGSLANRVLIAVSDSGSITSSTVWSFYYFQGVSSGFADYPTLGIDANALYIGVNIFSTRGLGSFSDTSGFVVRKSSLLSGGPIVVTAFENLITKVQGHNTGPYTPQGVDNFDPAATEGYFIGVDAGFYGKLQLRRISNPAGNPTISGNITISVPLNGGTITVPHLGNTGGSSGYLDGLDYRLLAAHFRNGRLWTSENVAVDNTGAPSSTSASRMAVRWYEITGIPTGQTPALVQSGTLFQPSASNTSDQRSYWMGSIMVSGQGHALLGFSAAGASERINGGTVGRLANDPLGTMRTPALYTASSTGYNPPGDPGGTHGRRWGDFSYTCVDPADDMTMWTIQEYCQATDSYAVQVAKLLAPGPAAPLSCSPGSIAAGASNVIVSVTGLSNGDTGFFDPGPGFSNRIAAAISGIGVTVNNVTFTDPTHLSLNLSVSSGAAPGARFVTVVNPDGQGAVSTNGILTITTGGNLPPVLAAIPDRTVNELSLLSITNSATDPDHNALTFSLDPGAPIGVSIDPSSGVLTWTPTEAQGPGSYSVTVRVTDDGSPPLSNAKSFQVTVNEVNSAPVLLPVSDRMMHAGMTLILTNAATDTDLPGNSFLFGWASTPVSGGNLDPSTGVLNWTPGIGFAGSTNSFAVRVTDNGVPPLSATNTFHVIVVPAPTITSAVISNGALTISWTAVPGQIYALESKGLLNDSTWSFLPPDITASSAAASAVDLLSTNASRFYRLQVRP